MKCPKCGIERLNSTTPCGICGHKSVDATGSHLPPALPQVVGRATVAESLIWTGRPSHLYYIGYWLWGIPLTLMFVVLLIFPGPMKFPFLLGPFLIGFAILDQKHRVYTQTTRTVMSKSGIISQRTREVGVRDIRSINMNQGIVERLFGLGSVQIGSAGTSGIEVEFRGIRNPAAIRDQIRNAKDSVDR